MTDVRITLETADKRYGTRGDLSPEAAATMVGNTLKFIEAESAGRLPEDEVTPGFVEAELSPLELRLLTSFRASVMANPSFDENTWDVGVNVAAPAPTATAENPVVPLGKEMGIPASDSAEFEAAVAQYSASEPGRLPRLPVFPPGSVDAQLQSADIAAKQGQADREANRLRG